MKSGKKRILVVLGIVILMAVTASGWTYNVVKSRSDAKATEAAILQQTFLQQYGDTAVIKQLVSPDRVYAALWTDGDGIQHVSWNIGGLWLTVYSGNPSTP